MRNAIAFLQHHQSCISTWRVPTAHTPVSGEVFFSFFATVNHIYMEVSRCELSEQEYTLIFLYRCVG